MGMSGAFRQVYRAYKYFQRDEEIDDAGALVVFYERNGPVVDLELRAEFVKNVPRTVNSITAEQQSFVQQQIDSIDYKDDSGWEKLDKDSSVFVKLSKKHNKGESNSWGKATTTIDASAENALAWIWDYCSNERLDTVKKLHKNPRELRERFNRDDEIDQEERNELMGVMKNNKNEVYSEEENEMVGKNYQEDGKRQARLVHPVELSRLSNQDEHCAH
ncbi:hypothetical protein ScalyP_jg10123 [Parmales sp. scaly parma]|nr:hypothetical protein ScalyP_jg10123 [Parmales sp. scaly parma]